MPDKTWKRYRFYTRAAEDPRPLIFDPRFPWWCSGYGEDTAIIVAFLPTDEPLSKYWDDAFDIDEEGCDGPSFTDRFPRPTWMPVTDEQR